MHAIVTKMTLGKPVDAPLLRSIEEGFLSQARRRPEFLDLKLVRVSDTEAIFLVFFTTREALDEMSRDVAGPWFAEHVRPYLAGPVERSVGEVVMDATKR
jgi:hypothetical protein